ncbi:MAG: DsrE/DsrF/DrsH-like family protein, partial [Endomicrobiia bacterium]
GFGTLMMKMVMKSKNVSTLQQLIDDAQKNGVKFIACNMSMDVMGVKQEELIDGVEIGGVAKYIAESNNANSNLFI